ncbi:unnamed protein product [Chilo suppressalis]|uniref:C2H2-type domain-containing protein n=1 Tax=Chilo suppressalis TaxID=168631 RepID=A0ABN8LBV9_CHISP|nr:unnamed protein product [Chilo suppressalis]
MDRLNQLREAGSSRDSTLDTSSPPSEAYMTANESSSKYFSLSDVDSTFDISPIKDVSSTIETERTITEPDRLISNLSPIGKKNDFLDSYKIGEEKCNADVKLAESQFKEDNAAETTLVDSEPVPRKDSTEVILQIDGKNVDAIDIGNGLYLYRKEGEEELAAVQIDEDQQQPNFKFLKVRENNEGNLEVYEEIQIEVPKEVTAQEGSSNEVNVSHVPIKDINKVISDITSSKVTERKSKTQNESATVLNNIDKDCIKEICESKTEANGIFMKFSESRKSPVVGSFTPMTYHSTPNKEGIPLTKTMVDLHLHPNRQSDNVKKTIEVHTDIAKPKVDKYTKDNDDKIKIDDIEQKIDAKGKCLSSASSTESSKHNHADDNVNINEKLKINCEDKEEANISKTECLSKADVKEKINCDDKEKGSVAETECISKVDISENKKDESKSKLEPVLGISNQQGTEKKTLETAAIAQLDSVAKSVSETLLNDAEKDFKSVSGINKNESIVKLKVASSTIENLETNAKVDIVQSQISTTDKNSAIISIENENKLKDVDAASKGADKNVADQHCKEICTNKISEESIKDNIIDNVKDTKIEKTSNIDSDSSEGKAVNLAGTVLKPNKEIISNISKDEINKDSLLLSTLPDINTSQEKLLKAPDNKKPKLEKIIKPELLKIDKSLDTKESTADSTTVKIIEQKVLVTKEVASLEQSSFSDQKDICNAESKPLVTQNINQNKDIATAKKIFPKVSTATDQKPSSVNHIPVPFGKWTEANRQAFLNKIKETKVPSNSSNGKQIKNSNDLNRRDVLKKIDSHRQTHTNIISSNVKVQDFGCSNRLPIKKEASVFSCKPAIQDSKVPVKNETSLSKNNSVAAKKHFKQESFPKSQTDSVSVTTESTAALKKEQTQRKEINNQDLIDKTIEDIINRAIPIKSQPDNVHDVMNETLHALQDKAKFDEIEKKMNELHGISCLAKASDAEIQRADQKTEKGDNQKVSSNKQSKIPSLLPFPNKNQRKGVKENITDIDSEEEIIEHEPITGDMDLNKKQTTKLPISDKLENAAPINPDNSKKEAIITENDFDKFVRRNSISYENCITVNFDNKEHNVFQTVVQKESVLKTYSKHDFANRGNKPMLPLKLETEKQNINFYPNQNTSNVATIHHEDNTNKNYHSKVKMAYQNAITAKRQSERQITIIEDKPVKVVFMESNVEFIPKQLNAQGNELSPVKKQTSNIDMCAISTSDSLDSDIIESIDDGKYQDETKLKTKHQRKQVLTPVETPELELIEPGDLGIEVSPKKKRKIEDKVEKSPKAVVPKKSYLLGRGTIIENEVSKPYEVINVFEKESVKIDNSHITHKNTASAIDNLVKAAELLETQSENLTKSSLLIQNSDSQQNTPVKRGRGRPRKYPLPEGAVDKAKVPTPQKKPRLSDVKTDISPKENTERNRDTDDDSSDGERIRENWTMGKINENILCPICNKLFRSENVVFKHVKHCTGPSPNRSDSSNKSPRRYRDSQDSDTKSGDSKLDEMDVGDSDFPIIDMRKKRKSRDTNPKSMTDKEEIIVLDTPIKPKPEKTEGIKLTTSRKITSYKTKIFDKGNDLMCEFCGKTFRQLSYLVNHKLQHEKDGSKKNVTEIKTTKSVFSCEVCKKEFRKLHHLVQHRFIHNPTVASSTKLSRKTSSEQNDDKASKDQNIVKQNDDASAGFRCEPCDKSFRKLHHLVEHRETHDGINRQKNTTTSGTVEKSQPPPQCEICKKTFRKLHHLIEHKEQHLDTVSEKSDDKSVKSSLSTKDIIHECPLCYMVFPNEHSLNKHSIICQRKKRQAASKQNKPKEELENVDQNSELDIADEEFDKDNDEVILVSTEIITNEKDVPSDTREEGLKDIIDRNNTVKSANVKTNDLSPETPKHNITIEKPKDLEISRGEPLNEREKEAVKVILDLPNSCKKPEKREQTKSHETLKKKAIVKEKIAPTVAKRLKPNLPLPIVESKESSEDDDEIRYMLNPNYKMDDNTEEKLFMKVRANKRNSLQVERPNSKDLIKRRISLQHSHKVPRLKPKLVQSKAIVTNTAVLAKKVKPEPAPYTDSDDSDIKYSFPKTITEKITKSNIEESSSKETGRKVPRKSLAEKRKSLSGIAKRKSLGRPIGAKNKVAQPSPLKPFKKRIAEIEHRCDCGELFSSAALLSRHTTLAHTPPRIRRRRSPPPETKPKTTPKTKTTAKTAPKKTSAIPKPDVSVSRKSSVRSDHNARTAITRKSSAPKIEIKSPDSRKSLKTSEAPKTGIADVKLRRYTAHKGVPVPEKMKKMMEKSKN